MASFVILLIARTAGIACADRHTYMQTHTHATTTVTLSAHVCRGLIKEGNVDEQQREVEDGYIYNDKT